MNKHAKQLERWKKERVFYYEGKERRTLAGDIEAAQAEIERLEAELSQERAKFNGALQTIGSQADDIERIKYALHFIAENGGTTTDGVSCNGTWCSEQARRALDGSGQIKPAFTRDQIKPIIAALSDFVYRGREWPGAEILNKGQDALSYAEKLGMMKGE